MPKGEMFELFRPRRQKGRWETRAEKLVRDLRAREAIGPDADGYADALRQAGADRDQAESDPEGKLWGRFEARKGWDQALSRLVAPPTDALTGADPDDPYAGIVTAVARATAVRDPEDTDPPD